MPEEKRTKRDAPISYRPPKDLRAQFHARVEKSGLSANSFITHCIFDRHAPRQSRRPSVEKEDLARLLAEAGKIARRLEEIELAGRADDHAPMLEEIHAALEEIRAAIMIAMERAP